MKSTVYSSAIERGILTSSYKEDVKFSFRHLRRKSIFKLREQARENSDKLCCNAEIVLKVAVCTIVLVSIFY